MSFRKINLLAFTFFSQTFIFPGQDKKRKIEEGAQENIFKKTCYPIENIENMEMYGDNNDRYDDNAILYASIAFQREIGGLPENVQERAWREYSINIDIMTVDFALELAKQYQNIHKYSCFTF